jgi:hypothetical protein
MELFRWLFIDVVFIFSFPVYLKALSFAEALRYKPERRGFDSRWCHWKFFSHNPFGCTMALGSTQPLTEMSTRNLSWG